MTDNIINKNTNQSYDDFCHCVNNYLVKINNHEIYLYKICNTIFTEKEDSNGGESQSLFSKENKNKNNNQKRPSI